MSDDGDHRFAIALDDLWDGEMVSVRVGGAPVLLVRLAEGDVHAFADRCPHAGAPLSDGRLAGGTLRCAAHHWEFDARTGAGLNPKSCALERYAVKLVGGAVWVRLRAEPRA